MHKAKRVRYEPIGLRLHSLIGFVLLVNTLSTRKVRTRA